MITERIFKSTLAIAAGLSALLLIMSCSARHDSGKSHADSASSAEEFHADNDIAMTIGSITDAIREGEPLDTAFYNFEGILTDGQGRPLYTNLQGLPGEWEVDILSPTLAEVRNISIGDLLPEHLRSYIIQSLGLSSLDMIHNYSDDDDEFEAFVYDFKGGYLRIENRKQKAANGLEGSMMRIIASQQLPDFAGLTE